jgi:hypothetical protein
MTMAPPPAAASRHRANHSPAVTTRTRWAQDDRYRPARTLRPGSGGGGTAYAAAIAAFSYALVSAYWALGGHGLVNTVGGYAGQVARREGAAPELLALAAMVAKAACGLLALTLVRPPSLPPGTATWSPPPTRARPSPCSRC